MSGPAAYAGPKDATDTIAQSAERHDTTARPGSTRRVTLLTGDRVVVGAGGRVVGVEMAKGREKIPVEVSRHNSRTLAVPADAHPLIADGTLEQRLFDVGALDEAARHGSRKGALGVIVGYRGGAFAMKARVRSADAAQRPRSLKVLNADAVRVEPQDATKLWNTLTHVQRSGTRTAATGITRVWLDGIRKATLDKSVPQIGAPRAWAGGHDGKGVKIAVLDTGVDATHPDLTTQVIAQKNFSTSADSKDRDGHGTHVASTLAGTGAKSGGAFKGVAPGAKILSGKVLDDTGYGEDAGVLAGLEWAVGQGAQVVNFSLGGTDSPELDVLEAAVNRLSAEKDILFVAGSGNDGPRSGTVLSPGSADAALTVGAVDGDDKLADFSSIGPRIGDGAIKPDVTAPGVDITAAAAKGSDYATGAGEKPPGYVTISGTSMATPHVAGAAAILKQAHPGWTYAQLKAALIGSAKDGGYSAFQQGAGRIQVDKAVKQTVIAETPSVSFGTQSWPHGDDTPVTRQLTYRNLGKTDVTLKLAANAIDPGGRPAPAGFFTLPHTSVTVPAGGKASVDLTVNTRLGGTTDGGYSLYVTATGDGQTVRTAAGVDREVESYDVTVKYIGRDGEPAPATRTSSKLTGVSGPRKGYSASLTPDASGTARIRLAKGSYLLDTKINEGPVAPGSGGDWIVQPKLDITGETTVTIDARTTRPIDVTIQDATAKQAGVLSYYKIGSGYNEVEAGVFAQSMKNLRTAHLGPRASRDFVQQWVARWEKGAGSEYVTVSGGLVRKFATGYTKHFTAGQFATVKVGFGAAAPGRAGVVLASGFLPSTKVAMFAARPESRGLPLKRTLHLSTAEKARWVLGADQFESAEGVLPQIEYKHAVPQIYRPGRTYQETFGTGVIAPGPLGQNNGVLRDGNVMKFDQRIFTDGQGHPGLSVYSSTRTTLHRNGTKIAQTEDPMEGSVAYEVPAAAARYRLTTSFRRDARISAVSTRIDASWTFRSKKTSQETAMPLSSVRFRPALALDSTAPAGRIQTVPVTIEGAAAGNLKSLSVHASYDDGRTWKKLKVSDGKVSLKNPAKGKGIALRAAITDKQGNKSTVSVHNAYRGR
ncbi:S8 family peptidase [Streptomyces ferrugineus]|nr:S8 family serine peptidase [Streptomyces ferrugineus]